MIAIRSLVLGTLLTVCQYVECQDQEFLRHSPFSPISSFARSPGDSHSILPQDMNRAHFFDQMDHIGEGIGDRDSPMMNAKENLLRPMSWRQNKGRKKVRQRRLKHNHRPRKLRGRSRAPNMGNILDWIEPDLPSLVHPKFGRRSNSHHNDNEPSCQTSVKNILLKIKFIRENIQDLEGQVMECVGTP